MSGSDRILHTIRVESPLVSKILLSFLESDDSFGDYASAEQSFTSVVSTTSTIPLFTASASLEDLHQLSDDQLDDIKIQDETMGSILDAMTNLKIQQGMEVLEPEEEEREATPINDETLIDTTKPFEETLNGPFAKDQTPMNAFEEVTLDKTFEKQDEEDTNVAQVVALEKTFEKQNEEVVNVVQEVTVDKTFEKKIEENTNVVQEVPLENTFEKQDKEIANPEQEAPLDKTFEEPDEESSNMVQEVPLDKDSENTNVVREVPRDSTLEKPDEESSNVVQEFPLDQTFEKQDEQGAILEIDSFATPMKMSDSEKGKPLEHDDETIVADCAQETSSILNEASDNKVIEAFDKPNEETSVISQPQTTQVQEKLENQLASIEVEANSDKMTEFNVPELNQNDLGGAFSISFGDEDKPKKKLAKKPVLKSTGRVFKKARDPNAPTKNEAVPPKRVSKPSSSKPLSVAIPEPSNLEFDETAISDPFKGSNKMMNSPPKHEQSLETIIDPFQTKCKVANSPTKEDTDLFKASEKTGESLSTEADAFQLISSPQEDTKLVNDSVICSKVTDSSQSLNVDEGDQSEIQDPFKSSTNLLSSPSPKKVNDAFKSSKIMVNSPVPEDLEDPFKSSTKIMNSPGLTELEDPFKSSNKIMNSPDPMEMEDPFKSSNKMRNSPEPKEIEEPFKCSNKMMNSPGPTDMESTFTVEEDIEDPFQSSKKLADSPSVKENNVDPFKPSKTLADSPPPKSEQDPFKSSCKMANSPVPNEEEMNPFQSKSKIMNSPEKSSVFQGAKEPLETSGSEEKKPQRKDPSDELQSSFTDLPQSDLLDLEDPLNEDDLPDLVKINPPLAENLINGRQDKSASGRFSTPEFEADEKRLKDEEDSQTSNKSEVVRTHF